jgi:hypothetical protein
VYVVISSSHRAIAKREKLPCDLKELRALCRAMDVESLAKMSRRNYKSSFWQADNCLEKRLCIAPLLVLA